MEKQKALEKLTSAIKVCQDAGLSIRVVPIYGMKAPFIIALPEEVGYGSGQLYLADRQIWAKDSQSISV